MNGGPIDPEERAEVMARFHEAERFLAAADQLEGNAAWAKLARVIAEKLVSHREAHEDARRHPFRRAEHLHAVKALAELGEWLGVERERAEKAVRRGREMSEE